MTNKLQEYLENNGLTAFKELCYNYTANFEYACLLDSCELEKDGKYELLAGFGSAKTFNSYSEFITFQTKNEDWYMGVIGYDVKNRFEKLESTNPPSIAMPELAMFIPKTVISVSKEGSLNVDKGSIEENFWTERTAIESEIGKAKSTVSKELYLDKITQIHDLIREGEVYELNYCINTIRDFESFDSIQFQKTLLSTSPVPMASYMKTNQHILCGASMERFVKKQNQSLVSQPIKGTAKRGLTTEEDESMKNYLSNSTKEKAENVMIVDLVRNDFGRVCKSGSIKVTELFGIHSFPQVHQMISTVIGELEDDVKLGDVLKACFPMGSMTGAPKIAAMEWIEQLEDFKRDWYSGTIGYVSPSEDFDFNVVIRSLIMDLDAKKLSYSAGGAITIDAVGEDEWKEVQLKKQGIETALSNLSL